MECAECMSTGQLCLDCQLRTAREEGRQDGYEQALNEFGSVCFHGDGRRTCASCVAGTMWRRGYSDCTADVVARLEAQAKVADGLHSDTGAHSYRSCALALECAAGDIANREHVGAAEKVKP